jgi:hypothetical protein
VDFRAQARATGKPIQQVRREWADANIGQVSGDVTYQQWLGRQPAAFQESVLGTTKAKLFREGGMRLDQFVDANGRGYTLSELARTRPGTFRDAGLSPGDF